MCSSVSCRKTMMAPTFTTSTVVEPVSLHFTSQFHSHPNWSCLWSRISIVMRDWSCFGYRMALVVSPVVGPTLRRWDISFCKKVSSSRYHNACIGLHPSSDVGLRIPCTTTGELAIKWLVGPLDDDDNDKSHREDRRCNEVLGRLSCFRTTESEHKHERNPKEPRMRTPLARSSERGSLWVSAWI